MNSTFRNILAVTAGVIIGGVVNMGIIMIGGAIIPPPQGVDVTSMASLQSSIHLFEPRHFIFPFLAHAVGTLAGATLAAKIAASKKMLLALCVGIFFLVGGMVNAYSLPAPMWFIIVDLGFAYIPMGWLGGYWAGATNED